MQIERPKIELYEMRSFGEKFSAVSALYVRISSCYYVHVPTYLASLLGTGGCYGR